MASKLKTTKSSAHYQTATKIFPGGVNSPVRAFGAVGGTPIFMEKGKGAYLYDVDGNRYIDYVGAWGPLILGHAAPPVVSAIKKAVEKGTAFGTPTVLETELAQLIHKAMPAVEKLRFVNSGTEAVMSAIRLARAYTGRKRVLKFSGCYHGHVDYLLVQAGSGAMTLSLPNSDGVPEELAHLTYVVSYNNLAAVEALLKKHGDEIACVIVEPIPGNMGVITPQKEFLEGLRELTTEHGALLIFDEVITGFRVGWGGAQGTHKIKPDLTCLGKIIGGGLPVGAYGGNKEIMSLIAPEGPVYQAGTLSGNPVAMAAGIATLKELAKPGVYKKLEKKTELLAEGLREAVEKISVGLIFNWEGSMFTLFFIGRRAYDYETALFSDTSQYAAFFHEMLKQGVYWPPSQFEACFMSLAHTDADIEKTIRSCATALRTIC